MPLLGLSCGESAWGGPAQPALHREGQRAGAGLIPSLGGGGSWLCLHRAGMPEGGFTASAGWHHPTGAQGVLGVALSSVSTPERHL